MLTTNYKGFDLIDIKEIPDCASKGIYLRHRKTGLEVFHLLNDDVENLFAFAFRTLPEKSNGAPHILEHSVLCGSELYPLKDPFIHLANQSVKTFLNAYTMSDRTVFPASSIAEADYFNLMAVYGDAVFFPLLRPEIFLQEAHRLEFDGEKKCSIQGVVYNEMKGDYSSFDSIAFNAIVNAMMKDTVYAVDSGGDPSVIPSFTYEQFKDFHKKYYRPDNSLLFLYGNIPTEKQLDFVQEKFLDRFENRNFILQDKTFYKEEFLKYETVKPYTNSICVEEKAPASSDLKDPTVSLSWCCGNSDSEMRNMECLLLSEILCGHDGSPLVKSLLESGLGQDISSDTGVFTSLRSILFTIGLRGVKKENVKKFEKLIQDKINDLYQNGIEHSDIDSALMSVDFSNREICRSGGPYSLVLLRRVLKSWSYFSHPANLLCITNTFNIIKEKIKTDKTYLKNLIKELFIDNKHSALVIVTPDEKYNKRFEENEEKNILKLRENISDKKIEEENAALKIFQQTDESNLVSCLPHINPKDLSSSIDKIQTEVTSIEGKENNSIPLFVNKEHTNGVVYVDVGFPVDRVLPEDYKYIPLLSYTITNMGWKGKSWAEASSAICSECGGFLTVTTSSSVSTTANSKKMAESVKDKNYIDRDWIFFRIKMLSEKTDSTLKLLSDCISTVTYTDTKRLKTLLDEYKNDTENSIIPYGHSYAQCRVMKNRNRSKAVNEIWEGLSQVLALREMAKNVKSTAKKLEKLKNIVLSSGSIIHISADDDKIENVIKSVSAFSKTLSLESLLPKESVADEKFYLQTAIGKSHNNSTEAFLLKTQVGFAARCFKAHQFATKEEVSEMVFAHWITNTLLWEKIRTIGGAYGAYASTSDEETFSLYTYRDPNPEKSLVAFDECFKKASDFEFDKETTDKAITGTYSAINQPKTPSARGFIGLLRKLYCVSEEDREARLKMLLSVTNKDLEATAKNVLKENCSENQNVIITSKLNSLTSKITKIKI